MSRIEYFRELEYRLRGLPERDRQNIIAVYEELFRKAVENGKSEADIADSLGFPRVPSLDALGVGANARRPDATSPADPFREPGSGFTPPAQPHYQDPAFIPPTAPQQHFRDPGFTSPAAPPFHRDPGFVPPAPPPTYRQPIGSGAKPWIAALALGFFNLVFILGPFLGLCGTLIGLWVTTGALILSPLFALIGTGIPHDSTALLMLLFGSMACFGAGLMLLIVLQWVTKLFFKLTYKYVQFNWNMIREA